MKVTVMSCHLWSAMYKYSYLHLLLSFPLSIFAITYIASCLDSVKI